MRAIYLCTLKPIANISPGQFTYKLPEERIALFPVEKRDSSKLLIRKPDGSLHEDVFRNVADYLPENSHLYFNNSRVIPARLIFTKESGSRIEIFCLRPVEPSDYTSSLSSTKSSTWECMIGNLRKFNTDLIQMKLTYRRRVFTLYAEKKSCKNNIAVICFEWDNDELSFSEILYLIGQTPLPPYIKRKPAEIDRERYQTVYSRSDGSVAAPTAGLHFTEEVLESLVSRSITRHEITLHVGAGTFQPIKAKLINDHEMHVEFFEITHSLIQSVSMMHDKACCVGTTTIRTLESLYWLGVKLLVEKDEPEFLHLEQWEPYHLPEIYSTAQSFEALGNWLEKRRIHNTMASTQLMIVPGYDFRMADKLITNFHQPGSTLLLLIAAFIGESWRNLYEYAINKGFRFLSYGDSSLLIRQ